MFFGREIKPRFCTKAVLFLGVLLDTVISSSTIVKRKKYVPSSYIPKNANLFPEAQDGRRSMVLASTIDQYCHNEHLYSFKREEKWCNPPIREFRVNNYYSANSKVESVVLIKNLAEGKDPAENIFACPSMKPIQIKRKNFSYRLPAVSLVMQYKSETVRILLKQHTAEEREREVERLLEENFESMAQNIEHISEMVDFVESVICTVLEYLCKTDKESRKINSIFCGLLNNNKKAHKYIQGSDVDSYILGFDNECFKDIKNALSEIEEIIAKENRVIRKSNKRKQKKENSYIAQKQISRNENNNKKLIESVKADILCGYSSIKYANLPNSAREGYYFRHLTIIFTDMIIILDNDLQKKRRIFAKINARILNGIAKIWKDGNAPSILTCNQKRKGFKRFKALKHTIFKYIIKTLDAYKKKGAIKYVKRFFDKKLMKLIEILLYLETEAEWKELNQAIYYYGKYTIARLNTAEFDLCLKNLREFSDGIFSVLASNIEKVISVKGNGKAKISRKKHTIDILQSIYTEYNLFLRRIQYTIIKVKEKHKLWNNPAFLHYNVSEDLDPDRATLYVIYKNSKNKTLCKKEIENSMHNLEVFSKARTYEDIESMEGHPSKLVQIA